MNVPGEMSVTVAVHTTVLPANTEADEHDTLVDVFPGVTVIVKAGVASPEWVESPPYVPIIAWSPVVLGVYVTVQDPVPWVAVEVRVQLLEAVKVPVELVVKPTLPLGAITVPVETSLTVAVQLVPWLTTIATGLQLRVTAVVLLFTVRVNGAVLVLPA
jgi:hypothetical protein